MKIYTKTGDKGTTSLVGGTRVSKASMRLEAYGTADELNSFIGLLRAKGVHQEADQVLQRVQNKLFNLGAYLATEVVPLSQQADSSPNPGEQYKGPRIEEPEVKLLEEAIDAMQADLEPVRGFILPAGDEVVTMCHVCRTICRRLERRMVALFEAEEVPNRATDGDVEKREKVAEDDAEKGEKRGGVPFGEMSEISLQYVNRLSDFLFILSKKEAKIRENALFLWEK